MEPALVAIAATLAASLAGSAAQTTVGFGIALFVSPVMFLLLDAEEAVLCTVTAATTLSLLMLTRERDRLALDRRISIGLITAIVPGVVVGAVLLGLIGKAYLQVLVGAVVLVAVIRQESGRRAGNSPAPDFRFRPAVVPVGLAAGTLNGAVSTGGPPIAIWLRSVGANPNQMRHTLAVVFVAMNLLTIVAVAGLGSPEIDARWWQALAGAVAGVPLGYVAGARILARVDRLTFEHMVAAAIGAVGIASAVAGIGSLAG